MFKNLKLRNKLLLSFFIITCISTAATTLFSILYFSNKIHDEAVENIRKHIRVAELVYQNKLMESRNTAQTMATEGGLQILVGFKIRNKINEYLTKVLQNNRNFHQFVILSPNSEVLGQTNISRFTQLDQQSYQENTLIAQVLHQKKVLEATEKIVLADGQVLLAIAAAAPIYKSSNVMQQGNDLDNRHSEPELIGILLVRYILNEGDFLLETIKTLLDVTAAIYHNNQALNFKLASTQAEPYIDANVYQTLMAGNKTHAEFINIEQDGQLAEYKVLTNILAQPVGVLGINISANRHVATTRQAIETLILIMLLCILGASILGYLLARSILIPIYQLLTGVKRITSGDLSHEIIINLKDEFGTLANSFNSMSRQLNDLFNTLEQRVQDATSRLQNTLAHMTAIIDNMADGLLVTDIEGRIIRYNPALSAMFPDKRNMQGQPCEMVFSQEIAEIARKSRTLTDEIHSIEVSLVENRYGKAVATAILQKDATDETRQDSHYIGTRYIGSVILIRDITNEKEIDRMLKNTIDTLTRVGTALSAENNLNKLLELCVSEARRLVNADAGTLYILEQDYLNFEIVQNQSMNLFLGGTSIDQVKLPSINLQENRFATRCARDKKIITANFYQLKDAGEPMDLFSNYQIKQMLVVPMLDRKQNTVGVLQLLNPLEPQTNYCQPFDKNQIEIVNSLASQAAVAIDNVRNYQKIEHKNIAFKRFVPTEFLLRLGREEIEQVVLGDASQEHMSVLFADIRSFTDLSENMTPEDNFNFLNDYLKQIGPNISNNGGFIDKYIGDAIMALFPGMRLNLGHDAVAAAVGMMRQLKLLNMQRAESGLPLIHIGIGIHSGPLTLGIIGFESRLESTVIGDSVNLASRLEGLTKYYEINIAISANTLSYLTMAEGFSIREVDTVQVKGKQEAVTVYEVFDADSKPMRLYKEATLVDYHEALDLYREQAWSDALALFQQLAQQAPEPDKVVQIYIKRCQDFLLNPPTTWEGVTRLDDK